jgi:hypothetical protein
MKEMRIMRKSILFGCITFLLLGFAGCGSKTVSKSFVRQDVDFTFIERIAVLPLENNTSDRYAAELARDATITQVLEMRLYDTIEKVLVDNVLYEEGVQQGVPFDPLTLKRIGQRLNAQALLIGTIDFAEAGRVGSTSYEQLALTLRLIEVNSGLILWQASGRASGESFFRRLFGVKSDDRYMLNLKLIRKLLSTTPAGYF